MSLRVARDGKLKQLKERRPAASPGEPEARGNPESQKESMN